MYTPPHFAEPSKEALHALIREHSFGILVTNGGSGLGATHLPLLLDATRGAHGVLLGHVARANEQWRDLAAAREVLAIFRGPHAYVSPSSYVTRAAVPTWNYVAVHVYGRPTLIVDEAGLRSIVTRLSARYEAGRARPWSPEAVDPSYLEARLGAIVGFEVEITRMIGKKKLSQNQKAEDRDSAAAALGESEEPDARAVARLMRDVARAEGEQ